MNFLHAQKKKVSREVIPWTPFLGFLVDRKLVQIVRTVIDAVFIVPQRQAGGVPGGKHDDFVFGSWLRSSCCFRLNTKDCEIDLWIRFNRADHVAVEIIHIELSI
jgi:hypothetical protein